MSRSVTRLYLAGKITKNCWRHRLVPQLRHHQWEDGVIELSQFTYVGPFFIGCDHACFHGPSSHGALGDDGFVRNDALQVIYRCLNGVADCDLLFAYIDAGHCYGSIAEIERALMLNKRVVMAFAPGIANAIVNEFWFVSHRAHRVHFDVTADALPELLHASLQRGY